MHIRRTRPKLLEMEQIEVKDYTNPNCNWTIENIHHEDMLFSEVVHTVEHRMGDTLKEETRCKEFRLLLRY